MQQQILRYCLYYLVAGCYGLKFTLNSGYDFLFFLPEKLLAKLFEWLQKDFNMIMSSFFGLYNKNLVLVHRTNLFLWCIDTHNWIHYPVICCFFMEMTIISKRILLQQTHHYVWTRNNNDAYWRNYKMFCRVYFITFHAIFISHEIFRKWYVIFKLFAVTKCEKKIIRIRCHMVQCGILFWA